jgi:Holliday junction DNA helicase RuvB
MNPAFEAFLRMDPMYDKIQATVNTVWDQMQNPQPDEEEVAGVSREEWEQLIQPISRRPLAWEDFIGNAAAVETLREAITAAQRQGQAMSHTLLWGAPGTGKTTLAKMAAKDMGGGFIETTASTLETPVDVIRLLLDVELQRKEFGGRPCTVFVDEIHVLGLARGRLAIDQESIFGLVEDWTYSHNMAGKTIEHRGRAWTLVGSDFRVAPFTIIGATTEPGLLSAPLLRRMLIQIQMRPYSDEDIAKILTGAAERLNWAIEADAAQELTKFSRKNPGVAQQRLTEVHNRAIATARETITMEVVQEVVARLHLFPLGLTETDVQILRVLADRAPRGCGQAELSRTVGISLSAFAMFESYLRLIGFVETHARRVITMRGRQYLEGVGAPAGPSASPSLQ